MLRSIRFTAWLSVPLLMSACGPGTGPTATGAALDPAADGLGFLPGSAEKGSLFRYYQPRAGSAWRNNWTRAFDLTGVSWNDPAAATLISTQHVVMAAHFIRNSHSPVMFHDKRGNAVERYVTAVRSIPGHDVAVGRLNLPVPPEIKRYRFANAADATMGRPVIVTDQTMTLTVHRIEEVAGASIRLGHIPGLNPVYQRNLITGDSGHPTFVVKGGELFLLETHSTGGPGAGPFYGDPQLQAAIRATMAELGN